MHKLHAAFLRRRLNYAQCYGSAERVRCNVINDQHRIQINLQYGKCNVIKNDGKKCPFLLNTIVKNEIKHTFYLQTECRISINFILIISCGTHVSRSMGSEHKYLNKQMKIFDAIKFWFDFVRSMWFVINIFAEQIIRRNCSNGEKWLRMNNVRIEFHFL